MPDFEFIKITRQDNTWGDLQGSWRKECEACGEEFKSYAKSTFATLDDLLGDEHPRAWVFALRAGGRFPALCQINRANLPGYDGPVIRVRFLTVSPDYDLTAKPQAEYGALLVQLLTQVLTLASTPALSAKHVKFHLSSPSDQQFFSFLGTRLGETGEFDDVKFYGAWLEIKLR